MTEELTMAKMLGVWMNINNPNRSTHEDLNLTVGGTVLLSSSDPHGLWTISVRVMDEDTFSDDLVFTDDSFQLGVYDLQPRFFQSPAEKKVSNFKPLRLTS